MTVLEPWTATSTTSWPSQWTAGINNGVPSVASNRGRLKPNGTGGYNAIRRRLGTADVPQIAGSFYLQTVDEQYIHLSIREQSGNTKYRPFGYFVEYRPADGVWQIRAGYGDDVYGTAPNIPLSAVAGHQYGFVVAISGYTTSARLWDITAGQTDPGTMQSSWTDTDTVVASGAPALAQTSGNTASPYVEFAPLTDGVTAAPFLPGAMMLAF